MWELAEAHRGRPEVIEKYLSDNYEPFAVSTDTQGFATIWLKREKVETRSFTRKELDALYSKSVKPKPRRSRKATKRTKGKDKPRRGDSQPDEHPTLGDSNRADS